MLLLLLLLVGSGSCCRGTTLPPPTSKRNAAPSLPLPPLSHTTSAAAQQAQMLRCGRGFHQQLHQGQLPRLHRTGRAAAADINRNPVQPLLPLGAAGWCSTSSG